MLYSISTFVEYLMLNYIYIYGGGVNTLVKEFSAAARIMQSSSKELSTLVADRVKKCKQMAAAVAPKIA